MTGDYLFLVDKCVGFSFFERSVSKVLNVPPKNQSISSLASYITVQKNIPTIG